LVVERMNVKRVDVAEEVDNPLAARLQATAARFPDQPAIIHAEVTRTWREVHDESRALAKALLARGVGRGDHIALWLPNHPEWLLLWLAALQIGATVIPLNTRYKPSEAAYVLRKSNASMLFVEREFIGVDFVVAFREICPDWGAAGRSSSERLPDLREVVVVGDPDAMTGFDEFRGGHASVDDADLEAAAAAVRPIDTTIIVFTSGTTGFPKGVMHTHDVVRMIATTNEWFGIGPEDRVLGHLPLFHVAGVFSSFLPALLGGGAFVQLDQWDPTRALEAIETHGITMLSGIPTHFVDLLRHPALDDFDTTSLRVGWIGGSTTPREVVRGVREKLGMEALLPIYGMTETTSCTTLARVTDPVESILAGKGVPVGGYEVRTVDPATREPVPAGTEGEIAVRGYPVMKGYYEEPEATAAVLDADGWFHTGDLGVFDEQGYLSITGRMSDKYIVGGNNVHPAEVERVLMELPGIKQAQVVAVPDDRLGEVGVAFVESDPASPVSFEEVEAHCRAHLASFKRPRSIILIDAWPMTPTGKIQKFKLRERARAEQG
jgi:acyl-CoA synthetase (AMP-forming)/AMP-acid ligase II